MKIPKTFTFFICLIFYFIMFHDDTVNAAIVNIFDGTTISGKIIINTPAYIILESKYGTLKIDRDIIANLKIDKDDVTEKEDIKKEETLDMENIIDLKKAMGLERKSEISHPGLKGGAPMRASMIGSFLFVLGRFNNKLNYGGGGFISFDIDGGYIFGEKYFFIPSLKTEAGYYYFTKENSTVSGPVFSGGPMWFFPIWDNNRGGIAISILPGFTSILINNREVKREERSNTPSLNSTFGYEHRFTDFSIFFNSRYMYVYDKNVLWNSIGFDMGAGYNF